jgi:hypothetical protein
MQTTSYAGQRASSLDQLPRSSTPCHMWLTFLLPIFYQEIFDVGSVDEKRQESNETLVTETLSSSVVAVAVTLMSPPAAPQHTTGTQGKSKPHCFVAA